MSRFIHVCTVCHLPSEQHDEVCAGGGRHWPPLCCQDCDCGSFEDAHDESYDPREGDHIEDRR